MLPQKGKGEKRKNRKNIPLETSWNPLDQGYHSLVIKKQEITFASIFSNFPYNTTTTRLAPRIQGTNIRETKPAKEEKARHILIG